MNSRKWIKHVLPCNIVILTILFILVSSLHYIINTPLRFTNSISYDAKINYLHDNKDKLVNAETIVIGSSMGLNNIESSLLKNSNLLGETINISSWGLKTSEIFQLLKLIDITNKKYVIYSSQYIDFVDVPEKSIDQEEIKKYIYNEFSIYPFYNTFKTLFPSNIGNYIKYKQLYFDKNNYTYLNFDLNGDVNF